MTPEHEYEAILCDTIAEAVAKACHLSRTLGQRVGFDFNGQRIVVDPATDPGAKTDEYLRGWEDRRRKYLESPEGLAMQARKAE